MKSLKLFRIVTLVVSLGLVAHFSTGYSLLGSLTGIRVQVQELVGTPSVDQVPLDPGTIPKFAHQLPIPRTFAPTLITNSGGQVVRHEYTVSVAHTQVQMLPPPFPMTTVRAFGGQVHTPGGGTEFYRSSPGPVFEAIRGIPTTLHWADEIDQPTFMPVDPVLHWANPNALEPPSPPFSVFPPGYADAQSPVAHVTHIHGLVVKSQFDGTAEEWFTPGEGDGPAQGPAFVSRTYDIPNEQPGTQLFYHDHVMGVTRLGVYAGSVGPAYFIRDPNSPLDHPLSPLPKGEFEIPLTVTSRAFFTDGELDFPRESDGPPAAYWQAEDTANVNLVNGKVWPNLNVKRQQYRFRLLAADNTRVYNFQFERNKNFMPFTIIGSDGGYLPRPVQGVNHVTLGITERADILFDFSKFDAGTKIILRNTTPGLLSPENLGVVMQFTVVDSPAVPPPDLPASLFPNRPNLAPNAPARLKTLIRFRDRADTNRQRSIDGLEFTSPPTEFPLVGSTEEWVLVHTGEEEEIEPGVEPDADFGVHQIHIHLIEFQVVSRQKFDRTAYLQQWNVLNGHRPVTRQIELDPTPYLIEGPLPAQPYEVGWKDTVRVLPGEVTRIRVRWAPQEVRTGGVSPGQNLFPFDPTGFPTDPFDQQGYVWHCHLLGHEDHEMMRPLPVIGKWNAGVDYPVGRVVAHNNINYRVRKAHTSATPPNTDFAFWERVNNNNGSWQPQIIYATGDRVTHQAGIFRALQLHQAQAGQTPPLNPALWEAIPSTACGQLVQACAGATSGRRLACYNQGLAGDETVCRGAGSAPTGELTAEGLMNCLSVCEPVVHVSPCSGLCSNPMSITVPDGTTFDSTSLPAGEACYATTSELRSGESLDFTGDRTLTVNGRQMSSSGAWSYPLPPQRNMGYCIQTTSTQAGGSFKVQ
jgi:spore coat protein A, manganese oxidase